MAVSRARPSLGTLVRIGCVGLPDARAHAAIEAAFSAIDRIHGLMSFHLPGSDVSRLNAGAVQQAVTVDPHTFAVLECALEVSRASDGAFDITVGGALVASRKLPPPSCRYAPDPTATWHEIELIGPDRVRFHRPLWIDLGGIAKGYAVDCAIRSVVTEEPIHWCVNAGGDLRVSGPDPEMVVLDNPQGGCDAVPVVELLDAGLASSGVLRSDAQQPFAGSLIDGRTRSPLDIGPFVSVVAAEAMVADALTKVVLVQPDCAAQVLREFGAAAWLYRPASGWVELGATGVRPAS